MKIIWLVFVFTSGIITGLFTNQFNTVYLTQPTSYHFDLNLQVADSISLEQILAEDKMRIFCIALAIYGEGRGETKEGMVSIGYVVHNRVRDPRFESDACSVILEAGQFEPFFPSKYLYDYALKTSMGDIQPLPRMNNKWLRSHILQISEQIYYNHIVDPTSGATHFWSPYVQHKLGRSTPKWTTRLAYRGKFGSQKYYN